MFPLFHHLIAAANASPTVMEQRQQVSNVLSFSLLLFVAIFSLVAAVIIIIGMWKVFQKAGRPGWASIVPFYSSWVLYEISGKPGWWPFISLLGVIPIVNIVVYIVALVLSILQSIGLSKRFGKGGGMAALLVILPFIGYPMLGFGDAQYNPNADGTAPAGGAPSYGGPQPPMAGGPTAPVAPVAPQAPQAPAAPQSVPGVVQPGTVTPTPGVQTTAPAAPQVSVSPEQPTNGPTNPQV